LETENIYMPIKGGVRGLSLRCLRSTWMSKRRKDKKSIKKEESKKGK